MGFFSEVFPLGLARFAKANKRGLGIVSNLPRKSFGRRELSLRETKSLGEIVTAIPSCSSMVLMAEEGPLSLTIFFYAMTSQIFGWDGRLFVTTSRGQDVFDSWFSRIQPIISGSQWSCVKKTLVGTKRITYLPWGEWNRVFEDV